MTETIEYTKDQLDVIEIYNQLKSDGQTQQLHLKIQKIPHLHNQIKDLHGTKYTEKVYTFIHGDNARICANGNTKKFISFPVGYVMCGTPSKCVCAQAKCSANSKVSNANMTPAQKKNKQAKRKATVQAIANGTYVKFIDKSPIHIDADVVHQFVEDNIKTYSMQIQKMPRMKQWIVDNTLIHSDHFPEMIYSAVFQSTLACPNGGSFKLESWTNGLIGCGPATECACTLANIKVNTKLALAKRTPEEIQESNAKREITMKANCGYAYNLQRPEVKSLACRSRLNPDILSKLKDYDWLYHEYVTLQKPALLIADEIGVHYSTVLDHCDRHGIETRSRSNYSTMEIGILNYLQSIGIECEHSNRSVIGNNFEIDLYSEAYKIGIEVDGIYWHSYNPKKFTNENAYDKFMYRHLYKTSIAADKGVELLHFTDIEWTDKQDIVKSILSSKFDKSYKLTTENSTVVVIDGKSAMDFFETNHLYGFVPSELYYGLEIDGVLVAALSAKTLDTETIEITRITTVLDVQVIGGYDLLVSRLKQDTGKLLVVVVDRNISNGKEYEAIGFDFIQTTKPDYVWTDGKVLLSRDSCKYENLGCWLTNFDDSLSESENMYENNYRQFWNTGKLIYTL